MQMILLAGPGVLISTFCLGSALKVLACCLTEYANCFLALVKK